MSDDGYPTSKKRKTKKMEELRHHQPELSKIEKEKTALEYQGKLCPENKKCHRCLFFKSCTPTQRRMQVMRSKLCINCFEPGHTFQTCSSTQKCSVCKKKHNTLLHQDSVGVDFPPLQTSREAVHMTANVLVTGSNGVTLNVRAILDSGASMTLISNKLTEELDLIKTGNLVLLLGVAGLSGKVAHPEVKLTLSSPLDKSWKMGISAVSTAKVIGCLPLKDVPITTPIPHIPHITDLVLSDPLWNKTGNVDILLGLAVFPHVFKSGRVLGTPNSLSAWETVFGWTVFGSY